MYLSCLLQSGGQPSACWLVKASLYSFGFSKNRTHPSQNCVRSVENCLHWEHPHRQHRGFFGFWKQDEISAERNFPEISVGLLKPSEKMSGASFLAARRKEEREVSVCVQLEERKGHSGLCFDPAGKGQWGCGLTPREEDLGLLFVWIGKKGNLGLDRPNNMPKAFIFNPDCLGKKGVG